MPHLLFSNRTQRFSPIHGPVSNSKTGKG